jgi:GT2 family glycosyltransferase
MNRSFGVGIVVLKQYDELRKCVASVNRSISKPSLIVIVDNGGELPPIDGCVVLNQARNIGCAGGWNLCMERIHPESAILLNDDLEVAPDTFSKMMQPPPPCVVTACDNGDGFSCFRIDQGIVNLVGVFDEAYWPAYYEDCDYRARMLKEGLRPIHIGMAVHKHGNHGERPYQNFSQEELEQFNKHLESNKQRFIRQWGGLPSDVIPDLQ